MKSKLFRGASIVALVLAGCTAAPSVPKHVPQLPVPDVAGGQQFSLASTTFFEAVIASVTASSSSPRYPVTNVTDGVLNTAWGPDAGDTSPSLTFSFDELTHLTALSIKLSLGTLGDSANQRVLVDVAVRQSGGDFTTIATGLQPNEATVATLDLPYTFADEVRLTFRATAGNDISDLLVCDVGFTGKTDDKPSPAPSVTPRPTCCVAVTGTSNVTVGENAFNFEINTAPTSDSEVGRVNFTDTRGTANPNDDVHAQWTIVATRCIIENGALTGAEVDADVDGNGSTDVTFTLLGDPPGNSGSHVQVNDLVANVWNGVTLAFDDFDTTTSEADVERSTQNVFPDDNCDGVPDPNTFPVD